MIFISVLFSDYLVFILQGKVVTVEITSSEKSLHFIFIKIYLAGVATEIIVKNIMGAHLAAAFDFTHIFSPYSDNQMSSSRFVIISSASRARTSLNTGL